MRLLQNNTSNKYFFYKKLDFKRKILTYKLPKNIDNMEACHLYEFETQGVNKEANIKTYRYIIRFFIFGRIYVSNEISKFYQSHE